MNAVVRVFAERAATCRTSLLGLAGVVPNDFWHRRAPGDGWDAHHHLAHALTADTVTARLIRDYTKDRCRLEFTVDELLLERENAISSAAALEVPDLLELGKSARFDLLAAFAGLTPADLEADFIVVGTASAWTPPVSLSLHAYLAEWAIHDAQHEAAIRAAISTTPDLSAAAHIHRMR